MFLCQICKNKKFLELRKICSHLRGCKENKNKLNSKQYYDKFLKRKKEGICPICNNDTQFLSISLGYSTYCKNAVCREDGKKKGIKSKKRIVNCYKGNEIFTCKMCNKNFKNPTGFRNHIRFCLENKLQLNSKQYYDLYLKKENEDICQGCKTNTTKFKGFESGYDKFCNHKCARNTTIIIQKKQNAIDYRFRLENLNLSILSNNDIILGNDIIDIKCNKCGHIFRGYVFNILKRKFKCNICDPLFRSQNEKKFLNFLKPILYTLLKKEYKIIPNTFKHNNREIDFYIPDLNITIDYNEYWHTLKKYSLDDMIRIRNMINSNLKHLVIWDQEWSIKYENEFLLLIKRFLKTDNYLLNVDYFTSYNNILHSDRSHCCYKFNDIHINPIFNRPSYIE